jgi:hypothetical protein
MTVALAGCPALARGAFVLTRSLRGAGHDVTGHVSDAGHGLAEEVLDEMAELFLPFLAGRPTPVVNRGGVPRSSCNAAVTGE